MTFENLNLVADCDCLDKSSEDNETLFTRRANKATLRNLDMRNFYEMNKPLPEEIDCKGKCGLAGVSLTEYKEDEDRLNIIKEIMPMTPKYKAYAIVIKLNSGAGAVKHTPIKEDSKKNPYHYDLYKSDNFAVENSIIEIKSIYLLEDVQAS